MPGHALAAVLGVFATSAVLAQDTTVEALFMSQLDFSEVEVRLVIADFEAANLEIKVSLGFVASEPLR
jgi:hypothetical protein